jgi:hypothetical protein
MDMPLRKHIQVYVVKKLSCGSFYFWSYTPWKIGFVASPETSLKQVFQLKTSYIIHNRSKFSKKKCVGYITVCSMLCNIFICIQQIFSAGHALQGCSVE